eukprot:GFUD01096510.1.p1 GENE.GFUD01096510.1~~GFUD01096510.1.p1  ORF type:complete len:289 (+),score=53.73 GFUD01096510.1:145-1011(+)
MKIPRTILLLSISSLTSLKPRKTDVMPSMEVLDEEHVLVDYDPSFVIPDFAQIKAISVYTGTAKNIAVATREDFSNSVNGHLKTYQKLQQKTKLYAKLNPCEEQKFFVRIVFPGNPGYLDTLEGTFNPNTIMLSAINSSICMKSSSLMLPQQKMMRNSPLLSKCLRQLSIHLSPSGPESHLQEGLNSLDNEEDIFTISMTNNHTGYTSTIRVDKKQLTQCSTLSGSVLVVVGVVLLVVVLAGLVGIVWVIHSRSTSWVQVPQAWRTHTEVNEPIEMTCDIGTKSPLIV